MIPTFGGKDEENVISWIERVSAIARLYQISDETLILAAVSQLQGRALNWYNRQPVESMLVWEEFKFQIHRYFECRDLYSTILARISSRVWRSQTEHFVDYAEDKLQLMQGLSLTEKAQIDMLADGVKDLSLRRHVLDVGKHCT